VIEGTFVRKPEFVRAWQLETDDTGHALADPPYWLPKLLSIFFSEDGVLFVFENHLHVREGEIIAEAPWGFDVCTPNEFAAKYDLAERGPFQRPLVRTSGPHFSTVDKRERGYRTAILPVELDETLLRHATHIAIEDAKRLVELAIRQFVKEGLDA
jgi:hypothetical protein